MALEVDITKKLDGFFMHMQFRAEREIFAILGASGCGKSMTLKCIAGIEKPDEGRVTLTAKVLFDSEKKINLPACRSGKSVICSRITPCFRI